MKSDHRITDEDILKAIRYSFNSNTTIPNDRIIITVDNGHVTLEGSVDLEYQRIQAKSAIEKIAGVRSVGNLITVKPNTSSSDIQQRINTAFQRTAILDAGKIKAEVSGTKVILRGEVRSFAEKEDAEKAAWTASGVHTVESMLEITESGSGDEESEPEPYGNNPD